MTTKPPIPITIDQIKETRKLLIALADDDHAEAEAVSLYDAEQHIDAMSIHIRELQDNALTVMATTNPNGKTTRESVIDYNILMQSAGLVGMASQLVEEAKALLHKASDLLYILHLTKEQDDHKNAPPCPGNAPPIDPPAQNPPSISPGS